MYSNSRVNRAGQKLKRYWALDQFIDENYVVQRDVLEQYRAAGLGTLQLVYMRLRRMVMEPEFSRADVTRRVKRTDAIVGKLARHQKSSITTMADVWGCRVLVETVEDVMAFSRGYEERYAAEISAVMNYISDPRTTGYRAIHLRTQRDGRRVEIQIRSRRQHQWAMLVQSIEGDLRIVLRDGGGPPDLQRFLRAIAGVYAAIDQGVDVDDATRRDLEDANQIVQAYALGEIRHD